MNLKHENSLSVIRNPSILGYYTNWSVYSANYQPRDIPDSVDTVLYAFAQVGNCAAPFVATENNPAVCNSRTNEQGVRLQSGIQDWKLHTTDAWSDFYSYKNVDGVNIGHYGNMAKTLATGKKVLLSIGGWTLSAPINTAIKPEQREIFIQSIIDFMHQAEADAKSNGINNKFAGVDIDWEPNGNLWSLPSTNPDMAQLTATDLNNYYEFLKLLKTKLIENGYSTLTIAMTANPSAIAAANVTYAVYGSHYWSDIADLGVELNLMSYDYNGQSFSTACKYTQFNSPLRKDAGNPCIENANWNINDSLQALVTSGVSPSKIGIGVPAYGRAYALNNISDITPNNPYALYYGAPNNTAINNVALFDYGQVWTNRNILTGRAYGAATAAENSTWITVAESTNAGQAIATSFINYTTPAFISYTNYESAKEVMAFAKYNGLASVMVWSLEQDIQQNDTDYSNRPLNWNKTSIIAGLVAGLN